MGAVMGNEIPHQALNIASGKSSALRCQTTLDQQAGAAADHIPSGIIGNRRHAFAGKKTIERSDEIGRGIDQSPIEIEDDGRSEHHLRSLRSVRSLASAL